jgi:DNA-binding MarR family transcriptional regulator
MLARSAAPPPADPALRAWVEEVAMFFEQDGLPRMAGRIVGWLLVCDPPQQTMGALARALAGSKASMSTMTRLLVQAGLIQRVRPPGARSDHFVVPPGHWVELWRSRMRMLSAARVLLGRGLALLAGRPARDRARLEELHQEYVWMEREIPRLLARWERERSRPRRRR